MNKPHVEHIHMAGAAGAPMRRLSEATAIKGLGLAGDRYWARAGFWQDNRVSRDVTLIEVERSDRIADEPGAPPDAGERRRNITTRGIDLNSLVGTTFWVGEVLTTGANLCEPCRHLVELTGRPLLRPMVHRDLAAAPGPCDMVGPAIRLLRRML
jgi:MOSC domain-containing protein YiiM